MNSIYFFATKRAHALVLSFFEKLFLYLFFMFIKKCATTK